MQEELVYRNVAAVADEALVVRAEHHSMTAVQARTLLQALQGDRRGAVFAVTLALGLRDILGAQALAEGVFVPALDGGGGAAPVREPGGGGGG
jgi:hypothetical protein